MCGLSGFIGVKDESARMMLVLTLAQGIDNRGGHASGYISIAEDSLRFAKRRGPWLAAKPRFLKGATEGNLCMMHARFATCGSNTPENAHPFAIRREGKVVLWGAHNGMIPDAWSSAKENNRSFDVDSKELFELLADKDYKAIQEMCGYGVITWVERETPHHVNMARLSSDSDICVIGLEEGGIVWGSTWKIVSEALTAANLKARCSFEVNDIGRVYQFHHNGVVQTNLTGVKLGSRYKFCYSGGMSSYYGYMDDDDEKYPYWGKDSSYKNSVISRKKSDSQSYRTDQETDDEKEALERWLAKYEKEEEDEKKKDEAQLGEVVVPLASDESDDSEVNQDVWDPDYKERFLTKGM